MLTCAGAQAVHDAMHGIQPGASSLGSLTAKEQERMIAADVLRMSQGEVARYIDTVAVPTANGNRAVVYQPSASVQACSNFLQADVLEYAHSFQKSLPHMPVAA